MYPVIFNYNKHIRRHEGGVIKENTITSLNVVEITQPKMKNCLKLVYCHSLSISRFKQL